MGAAVHQRAAVHDENHIAVHGGGHPLGDDQLGLPCKILVQGGAELRFRQEVQRGKAVVKNVDGRIFQQRTGNAQPLFLSAGQVLARLADHVVDTIREAVHEFSGLRDLQRFPDLHVPRLQPAHAHIVPDGAGIDGRVLQHAADIVPHGAAAEGLSRHSVHANFPGGGHTKAQQELHQRAFSRTGAADDRRPLSLFHGKGDVFQGGLRRALVAEGHMVKVDIPGQFDILPLDGVGHALGMKHLPDALCRHFGLGKADNGKRTGDNARRDQRHILDDGKNVAAGQTGGCLHPPAA